MNSFRPSYDAKQPLTGYVVCTAGRLSTSAAAIQKQIERLGGTFSTKIDENVGIVISSQGSFSLSIAKIEIEETNLDEVGKLSKKIQDAQASNIHVVSEEFLTEIEKDRPSVVIEKCKISTWGILPHVRQQTKAEEQEKVKSGRMANNEKSNGEILLLPFTRLHSFRFDSIRKEIGSGQNPTEVERWSGRRSRLRSGGDVSRSERYEWWHHLHCCSRPGGHHSRNEFLLQNAAARVGRSQEMVHFPRLISLSFPFDRWRRR